MGRIKQTKTKTTYRKSKTKPKHCPTCGKFWNKKQVMPIKLDFTREEVKNIKEKIYLTDLQEKILDMKLKGNLTEIGMAMELGVSESTITYQWRKVKKKILKVI